MVPRRNGRTLISGSAVAAITLGLLMSALTAPAWAATPGSCPNPSRAFASVSLAPTGTTAQVGTSHTITAHVQSASGQPVPDLCLTFVQNSGPSTAWPQYGYTNASGNVSATWTSSAVGTDSISVTLLDGQGGSSSGTIRHTWKPKPTPSPTPKPTPTPTKSASASPTPSPTRTTHSPTPTPSRTPRTATTPPVTSTPTATPSATKSPLPPPVTSAPRGLLHLNRPSTIPGGTVGLSGRDCPGGAAVGISLEGASAGSLTAAADGTFSGPVQLPDASIGEHLITVSCGGRSATVPVDLVISSSKSSSPATTAAVLVFFVLLGSLLLGRASGKKRPAPVEELDD